MQSGSAAPQFRSICQELSAPEGRWALERCGKKRFVDPATEIAGGSRQEQAEGREDANEENNRQDREPDADVARMTMRNQ